MPLARTFVLSVLLVLVFNLSTSICYAEVIKLDQEAQWSLNNIDGFNIVTLTNIAVPNYALELLQEHGIFPEDHLFRFNERDYGWVAADTWTFTARWNTPLSTITPPEGASKATESSPARTLLILHGIDTAADVVFNHKFLGRIANAHRRHTFDVTDILRKPGIENILQIRIQPAAAYAAAQARSVPYPIPYTKQLGSTGQYNFIRKPASDFGWDWGPSFAPSGISGSIELVTKKSAVLVDVGLRQEHLRNGSILVIADAFFRPMSFERERGGLELRIFKPGSTEQWVEEIEVEILAAEAVPQAAYSETCSNEASCSLDLSSTSRSRSCSTTRTTCSCSTTGNSTSTSTPNATPSEEQHSDLARVSQGESAGLAVVRSVHIMIPRASGIDFWWPWDLSSSASKSRNDPNSPAGHAAVLYNVTLTYSPRREKESSFWSTPGEEPQPQPLPQQAQQVVARRIGFRTVELVRQPTGAKGETFQFVVNGVPVFARGANVVPIDLLETRVTEKRVRRLVAAARAANMNMLRVWGGGRYFQDSFYDACDEAGILLWQEFTYACAMYPRHPHFLTEASEEARQQALRLNSHPSVIVWGGNNENEAAFTWFQEPMTNPMLYAIDYDVLFSQTLRRQLEFIDPSAIYLDSSPSNGIVVQGIDSRTGGTDSGTDGDGDAEVDLDKNPDSNNLLSRSGSPPERSGSVVLDLSSRCADDYYVKRWGDVRDPSRGDIHFYDYRSNMFDPRSFPPAKFVSEFGYMSLPSFETFQQQSTEEDWAVDSEGMRFRMRHANGFEELKRQLEMHFICASTTTLDQENDGFGQQGSRGTISRCTQLSTGVAVASTTASPLSALAPPLPLGSPTGNSTLKEQLDTFKAFIYLTQVQQAMVYETGASKWRRGKSDPQSATAGLLYWQLNDVWAGPSWSSLNYDGRWKPLHYAARRFFKPVAVFGVVVDQTSGGTDTTGGSGEGGGGGIFAAIGEAFSSFLDPVVRQPVRLPAGKKDLSEIQVWVVNDGGSTVAGHVTVDAVPFQAVASLEILSLAYQAPVIVRGSDSVIAWRSSLSQTQWGSVAAAAPYVYLRMRYCVSNNNNSGTANGTTTGDLNDQKDLSNGSCTESILLLGELKDAALPPAQLSITVTDPSTSARTARTAAPGVEILDPGTSLEIDLFPPEEGFDHPPGGNCNGAPISENTNGVEFNENISLPNKQCEAFEVTLSARNGVALFAVVESSLNGVFSNNLIMVTPWEPKKLRFYVTQEEEIEEKKGADSYVGIDSEVVRKSLRVTWMQGAKFNAARNGSNGNVGRGRLIFVAAAVPFLMAGLIFDWEAFI